MEKAKVVASFILNQDLSEYLFDPLYEFKYGTRPDNDEKAYFSDAYDEYNSSYEEDDSYDSYDDDDED